MRAWTPAGRSPASTASASTRKSTCRRCSPRRISTRSSACAARSTRPGWRIPARGCRRRACAAGGRARTPPNPPQRRGPGGGVVGPAGGGAGPAPPASAGGGGPGGGVLRPGEEAGAEIGGREAVRPRGGGTKLGGSPQTDAVVFDPRRFDRILEHNEGDFTAILEAG